MKNDEHAGNAILLIVVCISLLIALVLAWCLTLLKMKVPIAVETFVDKEALLSSHLDFLMMTMLLLGFYASKITLPKYVVWPMAIGSLGNPTIFLIGSIYPNNQSPIMMLFVMTSISLTTFGYAMASIKLLRYALKPSSGASVHLGAERSSI